MSAPAPLYCGQAARERLAMMLRQPADCIDMLLAGEAQGSEVREVLRLQSLTPKLTTAFPLRTM